MSRLSRNTLREPEVVYRRSRGEQIEMPKPRICGGCNCVIDNDGNCGPGCTVRRGDSNDNKPRVPRVG